ncbi:MAG: hypothetical protein JO264_00915, partial [Acidisphaera sp.]|nr:hypothetical protein [Acidisphaera sp.]
MRWLAWIAAALLAVPVLAVAVLLVALNLAPGQRLAERLAGQFTGGMVQVQGLSGGIPWAPRIAHLEVADASGTWLTIDDLALDWSPLRLLGRDAAISRLAASRIALARLPESQPAGPAKPGRNAPLRLPVRVDLDALHVGRLELAPPIAGMAAAVSIDGAAHLASLTDGDAALTVQRLDGAGSYRVSGRIDAAHIVATVTAQEPPHGLVSGLAGLPDLGALSLNATLDGPWSATGVKLALTAGQLHAAAQGTVDVTGRAADLDVTAGAPAMAPRPDVSWQSVSLDAHVHGPFTKPEAAATLRIDTLAAAGAAIARLAADVRGDAGHLAVQATVTGLTVPGPKPDLLQSSPLVLTAAAQLDAPTRPVTFALTHPLLQAQGSAETAGAMQGQMTLTLPDLAPFAAVGGIDLHGSTVLTAKAAMQGDTTSADIDGRLHITGGMAPVPGLLGDATLGVSAALRGADITLSRLQLEGSTLRLSATGVKAADRLSLDWHLALADLKVLAPTLAGALQGQGKISGTPENFTATADLAGDVGTQGLPRGPVKLSLNATGLPAAPAGRLTAEGVLDRAPLSLVVAAQRGGDGTLHLAI